MIRQRTSTEKLIRDSVKKFQAWRSIIDPVGGIRFGGGDYVLKTTLRKELQAYFLDASQCIPSDPAKWPREVAWLNYRSGMHEGARRSYGHHLQRLERRGLFLKALMVLSVRNHPTLSHLSAAFSVPERLSEDLRKAADAVIEWSRRFNLHGDPHGFENDASAIEQNWKSWSWPLCVAEETLWQWTTNPGPDDMLGLKPLRWPWIQTTTGTRPPKTLVPIVFKPPIPDWQPLREPEERFRKRVRAAFERWLADLIQTRVQEAESHGAIKAPRKRKLEPFIWLAVYQVEEISIKTIANACDQTEDAVKDACDSTLDLIGLTRRRAKRGPQRRKSGD